MPSKARRRAVTTAPGIRRRMARPVMVLPEPDLADDGEALAAEGEGDAAHRLDGAGLGREADVQVLDLEQRSSRRS